MHFGMRSFVLSVLIFEISAKRGRHRNRERLRAEADCYDTENFNSYAGTIARTAQGFTCQKVANQMSRNFSFQRKKKESQRFI